MIDKILKTVEDNHMIKCHDGIIVALSGGPDSMSLLHALITLKDRFNLRLYAAHVNHMLRGEDSDKDEEGCREFCKDYDIEFFSKSINIDIMAQEKNISHEMAGREARYEFFMELKNKLGADKIALAHNVNDQAETILMRLMRGTGLEGLVGIKAVRDHIYIRPLINVSRKEIEEYCEENSLPIRIDKTNFENIYSRNKIRLELIPYIEEHFNKDIISTLNRMSTLVKIDEDYISKSALKFFRKYCDIKADRVIIYKDAFNLHEAILSRIIRKALSNIKGDMYNLENVHIDNVISIQNGDTGKFTKIPKGIIAKNVYGNIEIVKENADCSELKDINIELKIGENYIEELKLKICIKVTDNDSELRLKCNNTKYFSFDNKFSSIKLRFRKNGDKFTPLGMNGNRKLKDVFMDMKIPREERERIPLLCFDEEISWIIGYRISDKFKIHQHTRKILQVTIER